MQRLLLSRTLRAPQVSVSVLCTSKASKCKDYYFRGPFELLRCQYLYFCTSKASKCKDYYFRGPFELLRCQYLYFCTSKASKLSTFELLSHGHAEPRVEVSVVFFVFERSKPDGMLRAILLFSLLGYSVYFQYYYSVYFASQFTRSYSVYFVFERGEPDGMLRATLLFILLALLLPKVLSLRHCVEALFVFFVFERS
jgi:hypothetical protein